MTLSSSANIPATQKAVVGPDYELEIDSTFPVPTLKPGQVLVKLTHSGVCHSDISSVAKFWGDHHSICSVPGHEGVGRVVAVHDSVISPPAIGTKVGVALLAGPCLTCDICLREDDGELRCPNNPGFHGTHVDGSYQQYIALSAHYLITLPEDIEDSLVAPVLCGGVTSLRALKVSGARPGEDVAIVGAGGGLGLYAIQYAQALGLNVIGIDGDNKREVIESLGAHFIDFRTKDAVSAVKKLTVGGHGVRAVIVLAGTDYATALSFLRTQGILVIVGLPKPDVVINANPMMLVDTGIRITGSFVGTRRDVAEAVEFVRQGKVKSKVEVRSPEKIMDIFREVEHGKVAGRIVLEL
ncbi:hypothetical protein BZA70DRAFT_300976 [Myxozyma melibiosi]|uniref:alcohol dehydrogenase n=1 Tax=Myxozyma melibiosi TaxID=54550 RepID=A0ABR1FCT9_9ASCO